MGFSMPSLDPLRIGLILLIAVVLGVAGWWVTEPWRAAKANKEAAAAVTATAAASTQKGAAQAVETNAQTEKRVVVVQERERVRTPRIRGAADPYGEFLDGMCESKLYQADPLCGSGGRSGGSDRGPK